MNDINDITIATLIVGLCLLLITLFIVVVGFESRLEKVLSHVIDGRFMMKTFVDKIDETRLFFRDWHNVYTPRSTL